MKLFRHIKICLNNLQNFFHLINILFCMYSETTLENSNCKNWNNLRYVRKNTGRCLAHKEGNLEK